MSNFLKKITYFTFYFLLVIMNLSAVESIANLKETEPTLVVAKELQLLNNLITITQQNLENQRALKELFLDYQQQQVNYLHDAQNKELTLKMVKSALRLLESIKTNHLLQTFDTEFISQLTFFSQFATKRGVPKT